MARVSVILLFHYSEGGELDHYELATLIASLDGSKAMADAAEAYAARF